MKYKIRKYRVIEPRYGIIVSSKWIMIDFWRYRLDIYIGRKEYP